MHLGGLGPGQLALVSDIAAENEIPKKFLDVIPCELRNGGFVRSKKGKGGGFALARPATEIRVGNVIRVLDGPLAPVSCVSRTSYQRCEDCVDEDRCAVRFTMLQVRDAMATILDQCSLADMRARTGIDREEPSTRPEPCQVVRGLGLSIRLASVVRPPNLLPGLRAHRYGVTRLCAIASFYASTRTAAVRLPSDERRTT